MGVIRKIGRKWYVDLRADGRRVRKVVGSRRDAERALTAIEADVLRGTYRFKRETRTRFDDFAESYLEHSKANKRSWQRDRTSLKSLSGCFGDMLLSKINAGHIEKYKSLRIAEVSPASVNRELACLSALFTLAKKSKLVDENPAREVQNLQERKIAMKVLNEEEARRLVDVSTGSLKSIVIIALNTGMRSGEIFSMRWNDVDFDQHFIFIKMTKSGVARKVPMNAVVAAALKTMKREGEFVFVNPKTGRPLTTVHRSFKSACTKARINDLRFHDLRHTAASWMVMGGVDLVTVAQILGHSDIKMTMRYAHPTPAARRQAVNVLAASWSRLRGKRNSSATFWASRSRKSFRTTSKAVTKRLLSVAEAAEYLGISPETVYRMAAAKEIPSVRIRGRVLFDVKRLDRLIERTFCVEAEDEDWPQRLLKRS